jgi:hypothetical protein
LKEWKNDLPTWSIPKDIKSCFASMVALKPGLWTTRLAKGVMFQIYLEDIAPFAESA